MRAGRPGRFHDEALQQNGALGAMASEAKKKNAAENPGISALAVFHEGPEFAGVFASAGASCGGV